MPLLLEKVSCRKAPSSAWLSYLKVTVNYNAQEEEWAPCHLAGNVFPEKWGMKGTRQGCSGPSRKRVFCRGAWEPARPPWVSVHTHLSQYLPRLHKYTSNHNEKSWIHYLCYRGNSPHKPLHPKWLGILFPVMNLSHLRGLSLQTEFSTADILKSFLSRCGIQSF